MQKLHFHDDYWYLVHCQARKESYASRSLQLLLGLSTYLPEYTTITRGEVKRTAFFPGYLFVHTNLQQGVLSRVNTTPGVLRLVEFGGEPARVPHTIIEDISEHLENMNALKPVAFEIGDSVRIKQNGPLQDLEMIFMGPTTSNQRVCVLLNFLGRVKEVYVDADKLEKVKIRA